MINFEPFHEKPPLYFWLQVISMKIFGISSFSARLPNAVLSVIFPVILFNIGSRLKIKHLGGFGLIFLSDCCQIYISELVLLTHILIYLFFFHLFFLLINKP